MKNPSRKLLNRYLITGAGIGLYFGLFFRPIVEREPNLLPPIALGIIGGLITAAVRVWRARPPDSRTMVWQGITSILAFVIFFVMMELRHWAIAIGGRPAVILLSTATGVLIGVGLAYFQANPDRPAS